MDKGLRGNARSVWGPVVIRTRIAKFALLDPPSPPNFENEMLIRLFAAVGRS